MTDDLLDALEAELCRDAWQRLDWALESLEPGDRRITEALLALALLHSP
jgi:hypothetical protein